MTTIKSKKQKILSSRVLVYALLNTTLFSIAPPKEWQTSQPATVPVVLDNVNTGTVPAGSGEFSLPGSLVPINPDMLPVRISATSNEIHIAGPLEINFSDPQILQLQARMTFDTISTLNDLKRVLASKLYLNVFSYIIALITPEKIAALAGEQKKDMNIIDFVREIMDLKPETLTTLPTNLTALAHLYFSLKSQFYYAVKPRFISVPGLSQARKRELYYGWHDCLLNDSNDAMKIHGQTLGGLRMILNRAFGTPIFPYIAQQITLNQAKVLSNDDTTTDLIGFIKSQLSPENQQSFETIIETATQAVNLTSQNPVALKNFLRDNMANTSVFYATAMLLSADVIQSMRAAQALLPIWFDQLYELTNNSVKQALKEYWQNNFINKTGVSYERGGRTIEEELAQEILKIFSRIPSRWLCTLWLEDFGIKHEFVEFTNWLNRPGSNQVKTDLQEVLVSNFPITPFARQKLQELFSTKSDSNLEQTLT